MPITKLVSCRRLVLDDERVTSDLAARAPGHPGYGMFHPRGGVLSLLWASDAVGILKRYVLGSRYGYLPDLP